MRTSCRAIVDRLVPTLLVLCFSLAVPRIVSAADWDELKVQRESVFEFVQKPAVTREGDKITIAFESKALCDVTVAIENQKGKIIRHLVSGVLGSRAPEPLQKNSKKQAVIWDGKNDQGAYVDDKDSLTVRVSLGLKPSFEKSLYWSPHKRTSDMSPLIQATEEGVFVYDGWGVDSVKMFDHKGAYARTVYPFPAAKVSEVKGLCWLDYPQGLRVPVKHHGYQQTFFLSGFNARIDEVYKGPLSAAKVREISGIKRYPGEGTEGGFEFNFLAATAMAGRDKRVALACNRLSRLSSDGSSAGQLFTGGKTCITLDNIANAGARGPRDLSPSSVAISPDGKWLYLSGYSYRLLWNWDCLSVVARMPLDGSEDAQVFLGKAEVNTGGYSAGHGPNPGEFKNATSVDCDSKGRVYVSDLMNDRVQVFTPEGQFLKAIPCNKPALVRVNRRNDEIYVFSWRVPSYMLRGSQPPVSIEPSVSRFGTFAAEFKALGSLKLPLPTTKGAPFGQNTAFSAALYYTAEIDPWAEPLTIWLGMECRNDLERGTHPGDGGLRTDWNTCGTLLLREKAGQLEIVRDFARDTVKAVTRAKPAVHAIQRIVVNPATGKLYLGEPDSAPTGKAFCNLVEIDPETGRTKIIELPFNPMEYAFDLDGNIYLRNTDMIARYAFPSMREIPWDYGTERKQLGGDGGIGGRVTSVLGGLEMPARWPVCYHQGGISVTHKGYVIASCAWRLAATRQKNFEARDINKELFGKPYDPAMYPGRVSTPKSPCIHVWDSHGKLVYEDAVPGMEIIDGVGMDRNDDIYVMHNSNRLQGGKPYPNPMAQTLMKFKPGKSRFFAGNPACTPVPLTDESKPKRTPDGQNCFMGDFWVENGPEWSYAGVGKGASNVDLCCCWFPRFTLDDFARSIAPETSLFSVAVVDSAGNLILRLGRYGNIDDCRPDTKDGSDGVGLFHPWYTATHTDRRIFIADPGNAQIASVKLGYHAEEKVALKDVKDLTK